MDKERFIEASAAKLSMMPPIQRSRIVETTAKVDVKKSGVTAQETHTRAVAIEHEPTPLPDVLTILRGELRLSKATLLEIFRRSGRLGDYLNNSELFMEQALAILKDCKAEMIMDGIKCLRRY